MAAVNTLNALKDILDSDDVFAVKSELMPIANKWKHIGCALGIPQMELNAIQLNYGTDISEAVTQIISKWLSQSYNVEKFGKPSWDVLAKAVAHEAGGANKHRAEEIARKYPGVEEPPERPPRPQPVAQQPVAAVPRPQAAPPQPAAVEPPANPPVRSSSGSDPRSPRAPAPTQDYADHPAVTHPDPYAKGAPGDLFKFDWYHGKMDRKDCEAKMHTVAYDCFIIRESMTRMNELTLSVKNVKGVRHFPIIRGVNCYEVDGTFRQFFSVPDLVRHYRDTSFTTDDNDRLVNHCPK